MGRMGGTASKLGNTTLVADPEDYFQHGHNALEQKESK